jgi:RNA polymerase sigma factor (sigma-70 family)
MKDTQILELFKNQQYTKASEKLYNYFPVVKKLVLKNNGRAEDAEDIYQEALIILVKKVQGDFTLSCSLNTYLYSVCRFLWSERLKKRSKHIEVEFEKADTSLTGTEIELFQTQESEDKLAENAFRQLGEKCRQLLLLFYFKKQSMKDIAQQLQFSSEKVAKNQKYRCLEKAKENLTFLKSSGHE